jgi:hypothetical protein
MKNHRASRLPSAGEIGGWLADRPWLFVVLAFSLMIGAWVTFFTLAMRHPPRDVLKNPLPNTTDVGTGH